MPHRYFETNLNINDKTAVLSEKNAHHSANVMRIKPNDSLILCDGNGMDYFCTVSKVLKGEVHVAINTCAKCELEPSVSVMLYVGYPKQDKLEFIIQKAVELGAIGIKPFFSKNCVVTPKKEEQKNERYNTIALNAAKQCGRGIIPKVYLPLNYTEMIKDTENFEHKIFCYEKNDGNPIHSRIDEKTKSIAIITGSEGGFTEQEVQIAKEAKCNIVGLGPRILRCETAPLAALSAVMLSSGNLQ